MGIFEVIQARHSVRSYKADQVEQEKLAKILEAARLAPTAHNTQAFKVLVIQTKDREDELKKFFNREWFIEAPLVLGVCAIPEDSWVRSDRKNYSDVDAAIVMDHMILTATDLGLSTCWIGAFDAQAARTVLKLDEAWEPVVFTTLGYANNDTFKKIRKSSEDIIVYK